MSDESEIRETLRLTLVQMEKMLDAMRQMRVFAISGTVKEMLDIQIKNAVTQIAEIKQRLSEQ